MLLSKLHATIVLIILHNVWRSTAVTAAKGLGAPQLSWDLRLIPTSLQSDNHFLLLQHQALAQMLEIVTCKMISFSCCTNQTESPSYTVPGTVNV